MGTGEGVAAGVDVGNGVEVGRGVDVGKGVGVNVPGIEGLGVAVAFGAGVEVITAPLPPCGINNTWPTIIRLGSGMWLYAANISTVEPYCLASFESVSLYCTTYCIITGVAVARGVGVATAVEVGKIVRVGVWVAVWVAGNVTTVGVNTAGTAVIASAVGFTLPVSPFVSADGCPSFTPTSALVAAASADGVIWPGFSMTRVQPAPATLVTTIKAINNGVYNRLFVFILLRR